MHWWIRPAPGNMGDWLSPYIIQEMTGLPVKYCSANTSRLISLGSIGRYIKDHHVVWGTGISSRNTRLSDKANYLAVRGPYTAEAVKIAGGRCPSILGDPGILLKYLYTPKPIDNTVYQYGFVRHFVHQDCQLFLDDNIEDLNILVSSKRDIERFIDKLCSYKAVLTTSLHVLILCHAYRVPCRLVSLETELKAVHGDGIKYKDFYEGAGLRPVPHAQVKSRISVADVLALADDNFAPSDYGNELRESLIRHIQMAPETILHSDFQDE
jgi:hypothetical protein